jgi:hypothetical protein
MKPEDKGSISYKARLFKDKVIIPQVEEELKVLVQVILGSKRTLEIKYYKDVEYADGVERMFDPYPSCKHWEKKYCHSCPTKYQGYIPELGYMFFGDNRVDIYCNVIKFFIGEPRAMIPFSY